MFVAGGIMLSRLAGLVRQRALARYLGLGPEADAFAACYAGDEPPEGLAAFLEKRPPRWAQQGGG